MLAIIAFDIAVALALIIIHDIRIRNKEKRRNKEIARIRAEQIKQRERIRLYAEEQKVLSKEQERQAKEQAIIAKEQERQAVQLAKHEEKIAKLEQKMSLLESDMRFYEHQRGNVAKLLNIAEDERDSLIQGSNEWQKAHKKVIALENQYHTCDRRLKKAMSDYKLCKIQKSA